MELAWMMLANHAEAPNDLLYMAGGAWDTVNVTAPPPPDTAPDVVTFVRGMLVIRLLFHATETDTDYPMRISIVDEDGGETGNVDGEVRAMAQPDVPPTWLHAANIIVDLSGLPLKRFGEYRINLLVNREHKGDLPFRVVKRY